MPVFKSGKGLAPVWCELEYFEIANLQSGSNHIFNRISRKEKLIVGKGKCKIRFADRTREISEGANMNLGDDKDHFEVVEALSEATLIRICGRWGDECGGSGLFSVQNSEKPEDGGDPVDYLKKTNFDNHYHDCDEYWIIFEGQGIVISESKEYKAGPGDCVVTGMGHHHDFPRVFEPVKAVFFETTMEGRKRRGHLWEHQHGKAIPEVERI